MSLEKRSVQYGAVFGDWHIQRALGSGSGGKSAVFEIYRDNKGWTEYNALKAVSLIEEQGDPEVFSPYRMREYSTAAQNHRKKAEQEVRLMEQLRGKTNIVDYLDHQFFEWRDETGFGVDLLIRMEKLSDLRNELKNGRAFSEEEIVRIGKDMCHALIICHKKNILHRDIKPENIFFNSDGDYKLGDFGISRIMSESASAMASTGIGTAAYSAPEQFAGAYDKRVDIYSLGLVLYEMANGNKLPFAQSSYVSQGEIQLRLSGTALPVPEGVSEALAKVILKACAFKAEDRYSSAEELLRGLENLGEEDSYATAAVFPPSQPADPYETAPAGHDEYPNGIGAGAGMYDTTLATETTSLPKDHRDHTPGSGGRNNKADDKKNIRKWIIPAALIIIILLLLWLLLSLLFSLLSKREHVWQEATCTSPEVCADCGETRGSPLGHTWKDATCTAPQTCVDCGETKGTASGHVWSEATCTAPQICRKCGATEGNATDHQWMDATDMKPATCSKCGEEKGKSNGYLLTWCDVLRSSNAPGKTSDVTTGNWTDSFGGLHRSSLRFWVASFGGWNNTEFIAYKLGARFKELSITIACEEENCRDGKVKIMVYGDDALLYESPWVNNQTQPIQKTLDVKGVKELRIACLTETEDHCYCIVDGCLFN